MDAKYRDMLFEVVQDPRFPGVDRWKELLAPTSEFKSQLVARKLVNNVNKIYGWQLPDDGSWTAEQANDVMFDIVAKPGFDVAKTLSAIALGQKA